MCSKNFGSKCIIIILSRNSARKKIKELASAKNKIQKSLPISNHQQSPKRKKYQF